jgi:hypothetical protein
MKDKKVIVLILFVLILFASCASMYTRPSIETVLFRQKIPGNAAILFKAAQKVLPVMGYKMQGSDPSAGTITTAPIEMKVDPTDCDCGTAMGIPVIKSGGTKVKAIFVLAVSDNELTIRSEITPELDDVMSTLAAAGLTVACASKGRLEEALASQFVETMKKKAVNLLFDKIKSGF